MSQDHKVLTPMNYMKIFFRRKEIFVIPLFLGLVFGICTGILLPKQYESSTTILVKEGKTDNPLFDKLAVSTTVQQRLTTISESMLGWNSLKILVERLGLDKNVRTPKELEDLIEDIKSDISIQLKGNNIIKLSYVGATPEITQAVVKNITAIFIERNVEVQNQETIDAIAFIEQQLKVYRGKIKSAEIAQLKDQLATLLLDSTEEHPQVRQLTEQIEAKTKELKKENLEFTESMALESGSTNPLISEIKKALDSIDHTGATQTPSIGLGPEGNKDIYRVMLIDKLDNVMARDVDVNNHIYNMLLQRLETAKITQRLQSSKEGTTYTIIDPPRIPYKPVRPNKILISFIGLILGGLVGFGLVVASEFLDKSFIDVEEAKQFLGTPLLGAISKINTEESIRREKERQAWIYSLTVISGVVLVIITTAIANFLN